MENNFISIVVKQIIQNKKKNLIKGESNGGQNRIERFERERKVVLRIQNQFLSVQERKEGEEEVGIRKRHSKENKLVKIANSMCFNAFFYV